jgi:hypothetical protein
MVRNGIDRLESHLEPLRKARLGVITNHTGLTAAREPLGRPAAAAGHHDWRAVQPRTRHPRATGRDCARRRRRAYRTADLQPLRRAQKADSGSS